MNILDTYSDSLSGNDAYCHSTYYLVEIFDAKAIVHAVKVDSSWNEQPLTMDVIATEDDNRIATDVPDYVQEWLKQL